MFHQAAACCADQVGTMQTIYDRFGLEFTDEYRGLIERAHRIG